MHAQIKKELEMRSERIKQIRTFGSEEETSYEEGYINHLKWVLKNLEELETDKSKLILERIFDASNDANFNRGRRDAFEWVTNP